MTTPYGSGAYGTDVYGGSAVAPSGPTLSFAGRQFTYTGTDGSTWDLSAGTQGVTLMATASGLHLPAFELFSDDSGGNPGAVHRGGRTLVREASLNFLVKAAPGEAWYALDSAWWRAMSGVGTLAVGGGAVTKYLRVRLGGAPDGALTYDPGIIGQQVYTTPLVAHRPFYFGDPVQVSPSYTSTTTPGTFWGSTAWGKPWSLRSVEDFNNVTLTNPGDLAAWPQWTVQGPCDGFTVGIGDRLITYTGRVDAGQLVTIETNPNADDGQYALDGTGLSVFGGLSSQAFAPIPPGTSTLVIAPVNPQTGTTVTARIVPQWRLPW